ncbi:Cu(I)/Ag(I) efflux system membrane fusion protein [Povalibacter uvarum]|uniref:Cu(I)/Ag(I) efflux system membrane fusion protein n=1 Tax=Povalibacter uvarum TaxID=732238 RepID=A0A841HRQ3_9GAMM|nr:efflux RND transporter periplasmic adaptor subunit [Povalibacter uvarum]MBB6094989.1 Cu(I)/Ag(I) efflux system membrane fusion protein [Povalibacter uvarum]
MNTRVVLGGIAGAIIIIAATVYVSRRTDHDSHAASGEVIEGVVQDGSGRRVLYWHDPMVQGQRFDRPGKSPFMDMQLVPKYAEEGSDTGVQISPALTQNLGIRTAAVERAEFGDRVSALGRIEADERRRYAMPARVEGYVERLFVRAVGDPVSKGEKVAEIYSPDVLSAQQEYLALMSASGLPNSESLVQAARRRLALFGMDEREIDAISKSRTAQARFGVYAPATGFVTDLNAREGAQIEAGANLLSIADLSQVWLIVEVPEAQSGHLRAGDDVTATLGNAPNREIKGKIDFIYPVLDPQTRTARVRIVVANDSGDLRPGMLATAHLDAMSRETLSVPSEAVIYTGERTIVIVRNDNSFRPVEVRIGAEARGRTEVLSGLEVGEQVVASGQFLIDSEASLSGVLARLSDDGTQNARMSARDEAAQVSAQPTDLISATGRVVSVDHEAGRVTLQHGPIPQLNWPEMTMAFRLADPQLAHSLGVGDVIRFSLRAKPEDGAYVIETATKEAQR